MARRRREPGPVAPIRPSPIPAKYRNRLVLSTAEVAELSPYCAGTIRRMIAAGKIPAKKNALNGDWLIPSEWVWGWLGAAEEPELHDPGLESELAWLRSVMTD